jgi:hypothetical protein
MPTFLRFRYLFDALETDLKETPLKDLVNAQFGGRLLSTITCSRCGSMSSREVRVRSKRREEKERDGEGRDI